MQKTRDSLRVLLGAARGIAGRMLAWCGLAKDAQAQKESCDSTSEQLVLAQQLKGLGDTVIRSSDLHLPGEHYLVAIRLYAEAVDCLFGKEQAPEGEAIGRYSQDQIDQTAQRAAVQSGVVVTRMRDAMHQSVFQLLSVPPAERRALARAVQQVCEAILGDVEVVTERSARRQTSRALRAIVTVLAIVGLSSFAVQSWTRHRDLARDASWRTSSELVRCRPVDDGGCPTRQGISFHTIEEENPWIEYDLGKPTSFSKVVVENARDGFRDRAVPLIVEIGDDQVSWSEVARVTRPFEVWSQAFPPVRARYVRFRVPRFTYLHLARIEVHK